MPRTLSRAAPTPPPVMTWPKASPVLIFAGFLYALRLFFESFWFFGPALAAAYCTSKVSGWVGSLGGLTAAACTAASGAVGYVSAPALITFGTVMAMVVGFIGWLIIGFWLMMTNRRIFEDNAFWFVGGLAISEIPILDALPGTIGSLFKMYRNQIKHDKAAFAKYQKELEAFNKQQQLEQLQAYQEQAYALEQAEADEAESEATTQSEGAQSELDDEPLSLPIPRPSKILYADFSKNAAKSRVQEEDERLDRAA